MSNEEESLVQIIFQKDSAESIDFEIAFTALIATTTLVTINSDTTHGFLLTISPLLLLVLTMIRRMAVSGRFAPENEILSSTVRPIEFLTILSVFQIVTSGLRHLTVTDGLFWISGLVISGGVFLVVVLQGLLFRNYRIWWGSVYYVKWRAVREGAEDLNHPLFTALLRQLASFYSLVAYEILQGEGAIPDEDSPYWDELRRFVSQVDEVEELNSNSIGVMVISAIGIIIGYGLLSLGLAQMGVSALSVLIVLFSIMSVRHIVGFWYLAYGSQTLSRSLQNNTRHLLTMAIYGLVVYWLFFPSSSGFQV